MKFKDFEINSIKVNYKVQIKCYYNKHTEQIRVLDTVSHAAKDRRQC